MFGEGVAEKHYSPSEDEIMEVRKAAEVKGEDPEKAEMAYRAKFEGANEAVRNADAAEAGEKSEELLAKQFAASQERISAERQRELRDKLEGR
jgi:hypothetical protein